LYTFQLEMLMESCLSGRVHITFGKASPKLVKLWTGFMAPKGEKKHCCWVLRSVQTRSHCINPYSPVVTLFTTSFNIQKFYVLPTQCICVLQGSENKQRSFPYTALTDWFLKPRRRVFTARYGLSLCRVLYLRNSDSGQQPASSHRGVGSIPSQSMWNLWLTKCHPDITLHQPLHTHLRRLFPQAQTGETGNIPKSHALL